MTSTQSSVLDFSPTKDPELQELVKNGFFLTIIVLLVITGLKLVYISIIFCIVMVSDEKGSQYPGACNLFCEIIGCIFKMIFLSFGLVAVLKSEWAFFSGLIYCIGMGFSLISDFITLISVCNSEHQSEYTIIYGLITLALVVVESLSLNVGSFYTYFQYLIFKKDNPNVQLLP